MRKLVRKGSETGAGGWCFFKYEIWGSVLLPDIESGVPPGALATEQERVPPYCVLTVFKGSGRVWPTFIRCS